MKPSGHAPLVIALAFAVVGVELLLAQTRPAWLAVLARLPIARERTIPLTPSAVRALASTSELVGYRDPPRAKIDLAKLAGPRVVRRGDLTIFFFLERGLLVGRDLGFDDLLHQKRTRRTGSFFRVDVRAESDRLILRAGLHTPGLIGMLLFFGSSGFLPNGSPPAPFVFFVVAVLLVAAWLMSRGAANSDFAQVVAELEARLAALEPAPPVLHRVADTAAEALPAEDGESETAGSRRAS